MGPFAPPRALALAAFCPLPFLSASVANAHAPRTTTSEFAPSEPGTSADVRTSICRDIRASSRARRVWCARTMPERDAQVQATPGFCVGRTTGGLVGRHEVLAYVQVSRNSSHVSQDHVQVSRNSSHVSQDHVHAGRDAAGQVALAPRCGGLRLPIGTSDVGPLRSARIERCGGEERSLRAALEPV